MTRKIPGGVAAWHPYLDRHFPREMTCDTCGRAKRPAESPCDGWWKRYLGQTERKCPDCKRGSRHRAGARASRAPTPTPKHP